MKQIFNIMATLLLLPISGYAYDFEYYDDSHGGTIYCNILPEVIDGWPTCEITYSDSEIIDGKTVYNQGKGYAGTIYLPGWVEYNGKKYSITGIADHAFQDSKVEDMIITGADPFKRIGKEAFKNCKLLKKVSYEGDKLEEIAESAFENCVSLKHLKLLPLSIASVCKISSLAFCGCKELKMVDIQWHAVMDFDVAKDAFDIVDGKIDCTLKVYGFGTKTNFEKVEPWCYFTNIVEFEDAYPTNIQSVPSSNKSGSNSIFNLNGTVVGNTPVTGLYIKDGKKILVK